jgi:hypothetical protein
MTRSAAGSRSAVSQAAKSQGGRPEFQLQQSSLGGRSNSSYGGSKSYTNKSKQNKTKKKALIYYQDKYDAKKKKSYG